MPTDDTPNFSDLGLSPSLVQVLEGLSFTTPTPVQAQTIPHMLAGHDLLAQAQTGTGKTAAFALPILQNIDVSLKRVQSLILAPTRVLAIQVAEAIRSFAKDRKGFKVTAIYGGDEYRRQLSDLKHAQVVVGTPGRVMDHIRRESLKIGELKHLILDEADEMLRKGFIEDVEWILSHTPEKKQSALFSATMPQHIRKLADNYLREAKEVTIKHKTATVERIRQRFIVSKDRNKLDVLSRILEAENQDGVIIFTRTKSATLDIAERLSKQGMRVDALNGDIAQTQRKRTVDRLKLGKIDIIVATDVAARGIDIERVSCVINYDMPFDNETYVHRIGRTGRAGRTGDAILFVTPREQRLLRNLERMIKTTIEKMELPSIKLINQKRIDAFKQAILDTARDKDTSFYQQLLTEMLEDGKLCMETIASALAYIAQGSKPLLLKEKEGLQADFRERPMKKGLKFDKGPRGKETKSRKGGFSHSVEDGMERYRIEVGRRDGVKPGNIVGAIANEAGLDSQHIGHIKINDQHSLVDLPSGMPKQIFKDLKNSWVCGKKMNISKAEAVA